ncbi:kinesin-like protein KIF28P isoform X3 [Varroa jacobsoni]|uniref:kinesin-like protein KIF28P isoform X3 n=1 Tax=Varroa jacobsoni TaxID=62625 RepID=UPI000BF46DD9|nr:kinesin-like protein KIF28P isoform X3 [Varroa jacobsoni]
MSKISLHSVNEEIFPDRTSSSAKASSVPTKASTPIKRPFTGTVNTKTEIRRFSLASDKILSGLYSQRSSFISKSQLSLLDRAKQRDESRKITLPVEERVPVRVAIRVRPFVVFRSLTGGYLRKPAICVSMDAHEVRLLNSDHSPSRMQRFPFERCYWSHDGFVRLDNGYLSADSDHERGQQYATQGIIHIQIGQEIVKCLWDGLDSTIIAYGESGSGKSYTLFGTAENKGLALRIYDDLFYQSEKRRITDKDLLWVEVTFSVFEIFDEQAIDLLAEKIKPLNFYKCPKTGYFIQELVEYSIATYKELAAIIERALVNRAVHATSTRRETKYGNLVLRLRLDQRRKMHNKELCRSSTITIIEAAGRYSVVERSRIQNCDFQYGFNGFSELATLAEDPDSNDQWALAAKQFNESLLALEGCLRAWAAQSEKNEATTVSEEENQNTQITGVSKPSKARVPFEDSVLTKLLQKALGLNAYVYMIATIAPEDTSYRTTLRTLQFAEVAKVGVVTVKRNEIFFNDLQKDLKTDIEASKKKLESLQKEERSDDVKKSVEVTKALIKEYEKRMARLKEPLNERMQATELFIQSITSTFGEEGDKKRLPHLSNLSMDPMASDRILHFVFNGDVTVGNDKDNTAVLVGPGIEPVHAVLSRAPSGNIQIEPVSRTAKLLINGHTISKRTELKNNDRILFGSRHVYVYRNPKEEPRTVHFADEPDINYWSAFEEIISNNGIVFSTDNTLEAGVLNRRMLEVLPQIGEANVMAEELEKDVKYDVQLVTPEMQGRLDGQTEIFVSVFHTRYNQRFEWTLRTFEMRLLAMRKLYRRGEQGQNIDVPECADPFFENTDADVRIGTARLYLQPLMYFVRVRENLEVVNFRGEPVGFVETELVPCNDYGDEYTEEDNVFIDNPSELVGKNLSFLVKIHCCKNLPKGYTAIYCCYALFPGDERVSTERVSGSTDPEFGHERFFSFKPANESLLAQLADSYAAVHVMGRQATVELAVIRANKEQIARQKMQNDLMQQTNALMEGFRINGRENLRRLVQSAEQHRHKRVPTSAIRDLLLVSSAEAAEEVISKLDVYESELSKASSLCSIQ